MSTTLDASLTTLVFLYSVYVALLIVSIGANLFMAILSYFKQREDLAILHELFKDSRKDLN